MKALQGICGGAADGADWKEGWQGDTYESLADHGFKTLMQTDGATLFETMHALKEVRVASLEPHARKHTKHVA